MKKFIGIVRDFSGLFIFLGLALGFGGSLGHVLPLMIVGIVLLLSGIVGLKIELNEKE